MKASKSATNKLNREKSFQNMLYSVGTSLSALRIKKGYATIREFAEHYDLPEIQYWRIEKGKTNITLKSLSRILKIHRVSIQDFFCLMDERATA
jgi:transcriptional regulator with XRE-family HTH domain